MNLCIPFGSNVDCVLQLPSGKYNMRVVNMMSWKIVCVLSYICIIYSNRSKKLLLHCMEEKIIKFLENLSTPAFDVSCHKFQCIFQPLQFVVLLFMLFLSRCTAQETLFFYSWMHFCIQVSSIQICKWSLSECYQWSHLANAFPMLIFEDGFSILQ